MKKKTALNLLGYLAVFFITLIGSMFLMKEPYYIPKPTKPPEETITFLPQTSVFATAEDGMITPNTKEHTDTPEPTKSPSLVEDDKDDAPKTEQQDPVTPCPTLTPNTADLPNGGDEDKGDDGYYATVYITKKDCVVRVKMEDYIAGVLSGEMAYNKNPEALKAQAVVAMSYYLKRTTYKNPKHGEAVVCDDPAHCMAYTGYEDYIELYGEEVGNVMWQTYKKIAVECEGEYLSYNGEYVEAMCHSSSFLTTESYYNLYGKEYDYLTVVSSPEKAEINEVRIGVDGLIAAMFENVKIADAKTPLGGVVRYSDSGRVEKVSFFGVSFSGAELRDRLGLYSTCFEVEYKKGEYIFTCYGRGHGIGLSQNGAYVFADMGLKYDEILYHYFPGCQIRVYGEKV